MEPSALGLPLERRDSSLALRRTLDFAFQSCLTAQWLPIFSGAGRNTLADYTGAILLCSETS